ncbi:DUF382-domain-containing protein [Rozella allomycis CSF55]|uniref:DUF382-domain-containing protein n=1 Tax=Rozella allomycis (strain CSF55) TaxID=988480 RepID=A0A4P9YMK1_ROZAC|nr:DUF382-domain-containing protein [Rozella allomycis CSF55]
MEDFSKLTVPKLKEKLKSLELDTSGLKKDLVERLTDYYSKNNEGEIEVSEEKEVKQERNIKEDFENKESKQERSRSKSPSKDVTKRERSKSPKKMVDNNAELENKQLNTDSSTEKQAANNVDKKKRRRKRKRFELKSKINYEMDIDEDAHNVEVEYVPQAIKIEDPSLAEFEHIFNHFRQKNEDEEIVPEVEEENHESEEEQSDEENKGLSKRKMKQIYRMSVAELKTKVKRPEIVEWTDVTSPDPLLLVEIKSHKNCVPVPSHWSQKRRYLQGKRGIEKPPFELPAYIKATGITELRAAVREREAAQKLKAKMRERARPKMGKLDIDYQKLHDAFFKYQTKPENLTAMGDLYYEGKEYELKFKNKRPGDLSDELKNALNMPPNAPPPWLINMQRYGPPPTYPFLKIPGLNAPIPPGCQWGFHPGGWGKPPVDDYNRPLYGDVFGVVNIPRDQALPYHERKFWGEMQQIVYEYEEEEDEEEQEEEEEMEIDEEAVPVNVQDFKRPEPVPVPQPVEPEIVIPEQIQLRKNKEVDFSNEPKQLYQVIPENKSDITGIMKSEFTYDLKNSNDDVELEISKAPKDEKKRKKEKSKDFKF